jgi:hypothetical protein
MTDPGTLLRRLIEKHFQEDGTWAYIEDTSIADVDSELYTDIRIYLSNPNNGTAQ